MQSFQNWIRKWLGLDRLDGLLRSFEHLKERVYEITREPTWLDPWPKREPHPFDRWQRPQLPEPVDQQVKFKGKNYSLLNLSDEEALDKLMKSKKKPRELTSKDKIFGTSSDIISNVRPEARNHYDIY